MSMRIAHHPEAFSKAPTGKHTAPVKDRDYLGFIATLPCILTMRRPVQVAHLSYAEPTYGHFGRAMQRKASDRWTLPLAPDMHDTQHSGSEKAFWTAHGINAHVACLTLYGLWNERGDDGLPHAERMIRTRLIGRLAKEMG